MSLVVVSSAHSRIRRSATAVPALDEGEEGVGDVAEDPEAAIPDDVFGFANVAAGIV